jgi:hypothetical protein
MSAGFAQRSRCCGIGVPRSVSILAAAPGRGFPNPQRVVRGCAWKLSVGWFKPKDRLGIRSGWSHERRICPAFAMLRNRSSALRFDPRGSAGARISKSAAVWFADVRGSCLLAGSSRWTGWGFEVDGVMSAGFAQRSRCCGIGVPRSVSILTAAPGRGFPNPQRCGSRMCVEAVCWLVQAEGCGRKAFAEMQGVRTGWAVERAGHKAPWLRVAHPSGSLRLAISLRSVRLARGLLCFA